MREYISNEKDKNYGINNLRPGDIVSGTIKSIKPYGAFVQINTGEVGLLHIEDISIARMKTPEERLKVGQNIPIMIKKIDNNLNRITLTYKELLGTWEENVEGLKEGTVINAIARETEKNKKGIFVEIKPNLVGMAEYKEGIEYGQDIKVYIKKIIPEKKKIKLIIKDNKK